MPLLRLKLRNHGADSGREADNDKLRNATGECTTVKQRNARLINSRHPGINTAIAAAVGLALGEAAQAQQTPPPGSDTLEEITVTATRRVESIQKIPFNITAIDGNQIVEQGLAGLTDLARETPGLYLADKGRGGANEIVPRGLSIGRVNAPGFVVNDAGGTIATYVGEVPLYVDLLLKDIERVEALLGPQGTLYGAGTLGGAIRTIPRKPDFSSPTIEVRGDGYTYTESDSLGGDGGFTINLPISQGLAFRASADYVHDPGYVDYDYLVKTPGVSRPEPNLSDPAAVAANLRRVQDGNTEHTLSGRAALRWQPVSSIDATLTYYYQHQRVGAAAKNHSAAFGTGRYVSADRVLEFDDRRDQLLALEVTADLGFAELTSASGYAKHNGRVQNDITDLLITLGYGYEQFPSFVGFSPWKIEQERINQEIRLVSKSDGRLSWIAGGFFNQLESTSDDPEYTPGFDQFAVDNLGGVQLRPDALEFADVNKVKLDEYAAFGELSYALSKAWKVIVGARWYDYKLHTAAADDIPLYETVFNGRDPNSIVLDFDEGGQKANGTLFKFSTSYEFTKDLMAFFTRSEGYRIGNSNPYALCPVPLPPGQNVCSQPDEFQYFPDKTINWELGVRSQWFEHRLTANASLFYIDWKDPQLSSTTTIGSAGITVNGKGARSRGLDLSLNAAVSEHLRIGASYSFTDAKLTKDAPHLVSTIAAPGTSADPFAQFRVDGQAGDRLPGSPRHQGTFYSTYTQPLSSDRTLRFSYGISAISNILTTVGMRGDGERLGGYALHSASLQLNTNKWVWTVYADNLFNKYAVTGTERNRNYIQAVADINGDPVHLRRYSQTFVTPRRMGVRFTYSLGR